MKLKVQRPGKTPSPVDAESTAEHRLRPELRTSGYDAGAASLAPGKQPLIGADVGDVRARVDSQRLGTTTRAAADDVAVKRWDVSNAGGGASHQGAAAHVDAVTGAKLTANNVALEHTNADAQRTTSASASRVGVHEVGVHDAQAQVGAGGLRVDAGRVGYTSVGLDRPELRHRDAKRGITAGASADEARFHRVDVGKSHLAADKQGLRVGTAGVGFENIGASNVKAGYTNAKSGRSASASADDLAVHKVDVGASSMNVDKTGMHVATDSVDYVNTRARNARMQAGGASGGAAIGAEQLDVHRVGVRGATFDADKRGLSAAADAVDFANVDAHKVSGSARAGSTKASASADRAQVHDVAVKGGAFNMGPGGVRASANRVDYANTRLSGLNAGVSHGKSGLGAQVSAGEVAAHELSVKGGRFAAGKGGVEASARDVSYTHGRARDASAALTHRDGHAARVSADSATLMQVGAKNVKAAVDPRALAASASLTDGSVTALDVKGGAASLDVGGRQVAGVAGDVHSGTTAKAAGAAVDLRGGRASASVSGLRSTHSVTNASVNILGTQIEIPDVVVKAAANANAAVDLSKGAAALAINLAGSQISVGGASFTLPKSAQAGVDVSLAERQLNINLGGRLFDVDEAVGRFASKLRSLFGGKDEIDESAIEQGKQAVLGLSKGIAASRSQLAQRRRSADG